MTPIFSGNYNCYHNPMLVAGSRAPVLMVLIRAELWPDLFRPVEELINPGAENQLSGDNVSAGLPAS